jgi:hypothetical protein
MAFQVQIDLIRIVFYVTPLCDYSIPFKFHDILSGLDYLN